MPRPRKYASAKPRCFHVDSAVYERLKRVLAERFGRSISEEVNELLRRRLEELDGVSPSEDFQEKVRYERLKRAYENVVGEVQRLKGVLRRLGCYDKLRAFVYDLGLDFNDLHNAGEIIRKLLESYEGPAEHVHLFISLIEIAKKKKELERHLSKMRLKGSLCQQA